MTRSILVADVGGTKMTLGLIDLQEGPLRVRAQQTFKCAQGANLTAFLERFAAQHPHPPLAACIGGAGPVKGDAIEITNLPWRITRQELLQHGYAHVYLINDLVAHAAAVPYLGQSQVHLLQEGREQVGSKGLIAAGTGLGEALIVEDGGRYVVNPSEGGHSSFAPSDEDEIELLRTLKRTYGHVSWERVVSGKFGFRHLARFLLDSKGIKTSPQLAAAVTGEEDIGALLHERALAGDPLATATIHLFLKLYGAEAGNLALKGFTVGGLYIGGGIIKQLMPFVAGSPLIDAFCAKGRFTQFMREIPLKVIMEEDSALIGAGYHAQQHLPRLA